MTKIENRTGDLFAQPDVDALAHGVNCRGVMGAGIAVPFKRQYPEMYVEYLGMCEQLQGKLLGGVMPWAYANPIVGTRPKVIYNLFTQDLPGPHADLDAVKRSSQKMLAHAEGYGVKSIALPRIGAGIGGLVWEEVDAVLEKLAETSPVQLIVVTLPDPVGD